MANKITNAQREFDEKELREYLEQTFGGIMPYRTTASYALEFLKTSMANLKASQDRVNLGLAVDSLTVWRKEMERFKATIDDSLSRADQLAEKIGKLDGK